MKKLIKYIVKVMSIIIVAITLSMPVSVNARGQELNEVLQNTGFKIIKPVGKEAEVMDIFDEFIGESFEIRLVQPEGFNDTYVYVLAPKDQEMAYTFQLAYEGNYTAVMEWEALTYEMVSISKDIHRVSSIGNKNKYLLMMLNPANYENFIWIGFDGKVVYDYIYGIDNMEELNLELY